MSTGQDAAPPDGAAPSMAPDWAALVQSLPALWDGLEPAGGTDTGLLQPGAGLHPARERLAHALRALQQAVGGASGLGSFLEALQALGSLVEDPDAPLPGSLGMALVLTQERLADLQLRKLLAARDVGWAQTVLRDSQGLGVGLSADLAEPGALLASRVDAMTASAREHDASPVPAAAPRVDHPVFVRDWWSVPVEGLRGSNQLFLLESRELLRSAELSLQALGREPADYAEQMVLCRAFQAVGVAAASMGLSRLAELAAEGERCIDELLEVGGAFDEVIRSDTDNRLQALYVELMELVGETVPAPVFTGAAPGPASLDDVTGEVPTPESVSRMPASEAAIAAESIAEAEPQVETALEPEPEVIAAPASSAPAAAPVPLFGAAATSQPRRAPWWWAVDWSAWVGKSGEGAPSTQAAQDLQPEPTRTGALPLPLTLRESGTLADGLLKLDVQEVQSWVAMLRAQGHDAEERLRLAQRMEEAKCIPLESWSIGLFRTARRVAREQGRTVDFDIEGAGHRLDASLGHHLMPVLEHWVAERVAQGTGRPLRLVAQAHRAGLRLSLGDGDEALWPDAVRAQADEVASWLGRQGGALRWVPPPGRGWELDLPTLTSRVPLSPVWAGGAVLHLPALWVVADLAVSGEQALQVLQSGAVDHGDQSWPVTPLSALMRLGDALDGAPRLLLLQQGAQRMGLLVESVGREVLARPLEWPSVLAAWPDRGCWWGVAVAADATDHRTAPWPVMDPFALQARFGVAARVLARSGARRRMGAALGDPSAVSAAVSSAVSSTVVGAGPQEQAVP